MKSHANCISSLLLMVVSLGQLASADEPPVARVTMPPIGTAPTIDGVIDEDEWKQAVRNVGLVSQETRSLSLRQGVFWLARDETNVYVAVKTEVASDGQILSRAVPNGDRDVRATFLDDSIELVFDPGRGRDGTDQTCYHIVANARGALYDWAVTFDGQSRSVDLAWRVRDLQIAQQIVDGWWHVEIAAPLASLGAAPQDGRETWGIRVARNWKRPAESADRDERAALPLVSWDASAPVVRVLSLHENWERPRIELAIANPHEETMAAKVYLSDTWHRDPPREIVQEVTIAPGHQELIALDGRDGGPEGLHVTEIRVTSLDGNRVDYRRKFTWSMHRTQDPWTVGREQTRAVDLQLKYYPYEGRIRFRANVESLAARQRITGAEVRITPSGENGRPATEPLWRRSVVFDQYVTEGTYEIPKLPEGKYLFALHLSGGDGVPKEPVTQPFVRQVFPWEHNKLGISDEVMPPFEPLKVDGRQVSAVLRKHIHGPGGLWEQVTSQGDPLLAGPMTWEVVASDSTAQATRRPVIGGQWQAAAARPNAVVGRASWTAGPLQADVTTEYDYDGMMLVTLDLEPTARASLDRLSLTIPLRDVGARYMHAVGDGLRHNFAGFTPSGKGPIWDSSQATKMEIPGTFYPYIWLGDGQRGICWFADTDRDWVLDDATPTIGLTRRGETLLLRIHFVTRPGPLSRRHKIVFGLQATPTKPMPDGWRRWTGLKNIEGSRPVRWLGANYYWGGLSYDVYPYKYRFDYFDKLAEARHTGQPDREFMADWMRMVASELAPEGSERYEFWKAHVNAGFHGARSSPWSEGHRLFGYTNPRGAGFHVPEFATFQDEWLRFEWFNRNWGKNSSVGYDLSPSRSYQDYALWHYREMLRCFDGVYWDNTFLSADFDPVVGGSWTDETGRVHPTLGLMHLRQLIKRTAVMLWQETKDLPAQRKPPITLAHMTNTMIVPVCSFLNCTMDWEWKYGYDDFQDRFPADLTVAESIGRQVGAWPTILAGGHPDPADPRVDFMYRTRLGVTLVHEIQTFDYRPQRDREIYRKLFEFGYGSDRCNVFNYWHPGHPVTLEGIDARTLVVSKRDEAIVVVTDFGDGGRCRVQLDLDSLGLDEDLSATCLETGQSIERDSPGVFVFNLKKHDFRILHVKR